MAPYTAIKCFHYPQAVKPFRDEQTCFFAEFYYVALWESTWKLAHDYVTLWWWLLNYKYANYHWIMQYKQMNFVVHVIYKLRNTYKYNIHKQIW
jgi:hypothetical protein